MKKLNKKAPDEEERNRIGIESHYEEWCAVWIRRAKMETVMMIETEGHRRRRSGECNCHGGEWKKKVKNAVISSD